MNERIILTGVFAVLFAVVAGAAEVSRPAWPLRGNEEELRRDLTEWLDLDRETLAARAGEKSLDEAEELVRKLVTLAELSGEPGYARRAWVAVDAVLPEPGEDLADRITREGSRDEVNLKVRDAALLLALRWHGLRREADAAAVRDILLRFAEAVPEWPLWDREGQRREQGERDFHRRWDGRGIWGVWFHQDLEHSFPLLRAYDLIYETLSPAQAAFIRERLFEHQVDLIFQWEPSYGNMIGHRLIGLARFGLVLPRPAYIHKLVELYENMVYLSFWPDGFFREVTPSYHTMPVIRMEQIIPSIMNGYSDPDGYVHPKSGRRIEDLDLAGKYVSHSDRWREAWDKLTLPNRTTLVVNEATFDRSAWWSKRRLDRTYPRLLGTSGVGVLGEGGNGNQLETYLLWAGTHGHEHYNVLGLIWWAHGREVFSSTNYRPPEGSESTREWHTSTAAHNLVVIDGRDQHSRHTGIQREITEDDALRGIKNWRYRNTSMNHGNLLLFDPTWEEVQVMEAEGERSYYPRADLYRRTLAMVSLGDGNGYMVDIFRVRGGNEHDYLLHGGLDRQYKVGHTVNTEPAEGTEHEYIELTERGAMAPSQTFTFTYKDGVATTSRLVAPTTADAAGIKGVEFLLGKAPAMRRLGKAPFVILRRKGEEQLARPGGGNTFILVHEAHQGDPQIMGAELLKIDSDDPEALAVRIRLTEDREDVFISTLGDGRVKLGRGIRFHGRLGCWRKEAGGDQNLVRVFDGYAFLNAEGEGVSDIEPFNGQVLGTRRMAAGDQVDGIKVGERLPVDGSLAGRTIHVDMKGEMIWSYRITGVELVEDGSLVLIEHEPGFEIREEGDLTKQLFYPGWGFRPTESHPKTTYSIPAADSWNSK